MLFVAIIKVTIMNPPSLIALTAGCIKNTNVIRIQLKKIKPLQKIVSCIKPCCYTTNPSGINIAIKHKHVQCLDRLIFFKLYWSFNTTALAALHGSIECLIFLHNNGCPWNERTCMWAATNGYLDCLVYAHKNGCEWDERVCKYAFINKHTNCLEYACAQGWYMRNGLWYYEQRKFYF